MCTKKQIKLPPMFFKVGEYDYLNKILKNGIICFGTFESYRKQEQNEFEIFKNDFLEIEKIDISKIDFYRRDSFEGLEKRHKVVVKFNNNIIKIDQAYLNIFQNTYQHLYCLYSFWPTNSLNIEIDYRMKNFGEHVLIIHKPAIFLNLIINKLSEKFDMDYVIYHNLNKDEYTAFYKRKMFSYQNEFRIVTNLKSKSYIEIGNLKEIATIVPFDELKKINYNIE